MPLPNLLRRALGNRLVPKPQSRLGRKPRSRRSRMPRNRRDRNDPVTRSTKICDPQVQNYTASCCLPLDMEGFALFLEPGKVQSLHPIAQVRDHLAVQLCQRLELQLEMPSAHREAPHLPHEHLEVL